MGMILARVILFAEDVVSTAAFYNRVFHLPIIGDPNDRDFIQLDAGSCTIAIHRGSASSGPGRAPKLVFRVEDVEGERNRLIANGVKLGKIMESPEFAFCDGRDPAGNTFQISSRP
ncbi:MAG: VOC family protein [Myxacorys chilensis ATA2-1-KO14]|jgi:predicted enzyme related to lactoylglutathione lyase|nr:VOC family protein [Myxacorys chilensis ATA2-1-KO14]